MTNEEAIKAIKNMKSETKEYYRKHKGFYTVEQEQKDIMPIDLAVTALEKQIPKNPVGITDEGIHHKCYCPYCEVALSLEYLPSFCPDCGQAMKKS